MQQRIEYIDFAKGYAIFTIVCYHALQQVALSPLMQKAIIFGGTGVHLFFLLSGFGLAWSASKDSTLQFYRRRMSKVWVPYVVVLTISWAAAAWLGIFPDGAGAWLAGVALYQMFSERYIESFGGHFWFISTIFQFYLVFPLLTRLQNKMSANVFLALAFSISIGWWLLVYFSGKSDLRVWNSFFLQFLWEFAIGMALAREVKQQRIDLGRALETPRYDWLYLGAGIVFTALMIGIVLKMGAAGRIFNDVPALLGYTALSLFIYRVGRRALPWLNRFFLWINGFSYSLYLIHVLVLHLFLLIAGVSSLHYFTLLLYLILTLGLAFTFEHAKKAIG
ncbi:MAG TPA: acyltransferase [Saprospiraceae bacterium]|nr:acyltransferase [Saprospiraceae bacterium]HPI05187.1 acyltransferase [Saprospiraceae bacterium]